MVSKEIKGQKIDMIGLIFRPVSKKTNFVGIERLR